MPSRRATFDVNLLERQIMGRVDRLVDSLEDEMKEIVEQGASDMQRTIDTAVTPTGERRVASGAGGHAGRRETDDMYNDVKSDVERNGNTIVGRFGWIEDWQEYYSLQEDGSQFIEGMDALGSSFIRAEDRLRGAVSRIR